MQTLLVGRLVRWFALPLVLGLAGLTGAAPEPQDTEGPTLADVLAEDGRFSVMLELIERAGLAPKLRAPGPTTLVAPIDAAFDALPADTLASLRDGGVSGATLRELLGFHAIEGRWTLADIGQLARVPSLQGEEIALRQLGPGRYALDVATVLEADVEASNGVLHIVDSVIQPPDLELIDEAAMFGSGRHTYAVDIDHSSVLFRVMHMEVGAQWGLFRRFEGELVVDTEDPAASSIVLAIDATSIDTGNTARDGYLRTGDFFDTGEHPAITFRSTTVRGRDDGHLDVEGELTMLGVARPVTCIVRKLGEGRFGPRAYKVGFETEFRVRRSEFGMTFGIPGVAGDEVRLIIALEGTRSLD
jgi:polyisoprenoid-binding protein YceI/uncharacterized surface protein with fasciclin (FAS1) repeats